MHDQPIPEVPSEIAAKLRDLEVERTTKWLKMIKSWDKYLHSDKLSKRVYKVRDQGERRGLHAVE